MMVPSRVLLAHLLLWGGCEAFSPSFGSPQSVSQYVREQSRFLPLHAFGDEDDADARSGGLAGKEIALDLASLAGDDFEMPIQDLDMDPVSDRERSIERTQQLREQFRLNEKDTGSADFQIASMTERINYLTGHMKTNPKDFSTRRGLVALVNKRRRLLNFLIRENKGRYDEIISSLGIRHKPPGQVPDREELYGRFPKQKAVKKHLVRKKK